MFKVKKKHFQFDSKIETFEHDFKLHHFCKLNFIMSL